MEKKLIKCMHCSKKYIPPFAESKYCPECAIFIFNASLIKKGIEKKNKR